MKAIGLFSTRGFLAPFFYSADNKPAQHVIYEDSSSHLSPKNATQNGGNKHNLLSNFPNTPMGLWEKETPRGPRSNFRNVAAKHKLTSLGLQGTDWKTSDIFPDLH